MTWEYAQGGQLVSRVGHSGLVGHPLGPVERPACQQVSVKSSLMIRDIALTHWELRMNRSWTLAAAVVVAAGATLARADEIPEKYRPTVEKGLQYLVKQQFKDGHWGANGDQYPVSMTGLAGIAMLMEGSTVREGKYATNVRRAADWLMERSMKRNNRDGLIG